MNYASVVCFIKGRKLGVKKGRGRRAVKGRDSVGEK